MFKVYDPTEKNFSNNGLGTVEPVKCIETKQSSLNGWSLEVEASTDYDEILQEDNIIFVETKEKGEQPFRICNPEKKKNRIYLKAEHIVFDAKNLILEDVRPTELNAVGYVSWCNARTDSMSPFTISGSASGSATHYFIRKTLLEAFKQAEEDFTNVMFDIDKFSVKVMNKADVGADRGFSIVYGKNLQEFKKIENWDNVCTKILPVGGNELTLPEEYLVADVQYSKPYTKVATFSIPDQKDDGTNYTEAEKIVLLRTAATEYLNQNKYPKISYELKSDVPQELHINDVVHIKHPVCNIVANVQGYTYDCISKRVKSVAFGNYQTDVKSILQNKIDEVAGNKTTEESSRIQKLIKKTIDEQTELINKLNKTGYLYLTENEMFILDKLPLASAEEVWRFGLGGIGFSKTGYKGPFLYAFTQDGKFNTDFITAHSITALMIDVENLFAQTITATGTIKGVKLQGATGEFSGKVTAITGKLGIWDITNYGISSECNGLEVSLNTGAAGENAVIFGIDTEATPNIISIGASGDIWTRGDTMLDGDNQVNNLDVYGEFSVSGTKGRIVETNNFGKVILNAIESPTPMFEDCGTGTIDENGTCEVFIDEVFLETVEKAEYQVFLQNYSSYNAWVDEINPGFFIVKGEPGTKFAWNIKCKQKGYSTYRLESKQTNGNIQDYVEESKKDDSPVRSNSEELNQDDNYIEDIVLEEGEELI